MIDQIREEARQRFAELGFPTIHDEDWRFTSVAPIARTHFVPSGARFSVPARPSGRAIQIGKLSEASVEPYLARYASFQNNPFVALNTANFEDGLFIHIPKGAVIEEPIEITIQSAANGHPTISHPRILIVAEPNSQATIIERYAGVPAPSTQHPAPTFTNPVTELIAGDHTVIDHYKLQTESSHAYHVSTLQVQLGRDTNFRSHSLAFGGALVRNDVNAVLSEGAECTLNGLYLVNGDQHIDNHTSIDHAKPHAASHELYKGILEGHSSAVFNGKILVRKDAQKTDAKQTNKNLVLSEDAVINTKPELQILADDVRCTHGATIGQLDPEGIFYLQSRGIGLADARNLLVYAFARDIVDRIKVASLRGQLEKLLLEKLHGANRN
ncbi:MAG TPA: Fe-S cluster assembly protein SufD [Bryobacteraceae bacterium]|nr:Fe-S cluster assembly protein SufD [Bryobacteraceae bacterium]